MKLQSCIVVILCMKLLLQIWIFQHFCFSLIRFSMLTNGRAYATSLPASHTQKRTHQEAFLSAPSLPILPPFSDACLNMPRPLFPPPLSDLPHSPSISTPTVAPKAPIDPKAKRRVHECLHPGCGKVYTKSSHLKAHIRTHSGWFMPTITSSLFFIFSFRGEAVQVWVGGLWLEVCSFRRTHATLSQTHGRQTVPLQCLRTRILTLGSSLSAHEAALEGL